MTTWRCSWQDYRGWPQKHNAPPPMVEFQDYETKEEAEARAAHERKAGMTVCVAPTPDFAVRHRRRRNAKAFNAEWRLHS